MSSLRDFASSLFSEEDNSESISILERTHSLNFYQLQFEPRNLLSFFEESYKEKMIYDDLKISSVLSHENFNSNTCPICLETDTEQKLKCNHSFHDECIRKWLKNNSSCPCCRTNVFIVKK